MLYNRINFYRQREQRVKNWLLWFGVQTIVNPPKTKVQKAKKHSISAVSVVGFLISVVIGTLFLFPDLIYKVIPVESVPIEAKTQSSPLGGLYADGALYSEIILPPKDENLPTGNWLIIPKIGIRTEIRESIDPEESLRHGVWRETEFATPETSGPMILLAHRFGYLKWSNSYRRQNSFYNLDKLEIGDTFEVIWDQRKYEYEIYAGEEGEEISDYKADIILYTCKFLNSPVRIFRYARRVEY